MSKFADLVELLQQELSCTESLLITLQSERERRNPGIWPACRPCS